MNSATDCTNTAPHAKQLGLSWHGSEESSSETAQARRESVGVLDDLLALLVGVEASDDSSVGTFDEYQECPLASFGSDTVYEPSAKQSAVATASQCHSLAAQSPPKFERAMQQLQCSPADLKELAENARQFDLLKRSLRKNGAVTNEVLKQKLPLFLSFSRSGRKLASGQRGASAA